VNAGHFGIADRRMTTISLAPGSTARVRFVKYTMIDTQVVDVLVVFRVSWRGGCAAHMICACTGHNWYEDTS